MKRKSCTATPARPPQSSRTHMDMDMDVDTMSMSIFVSVSMSVSMFMSMSMSMLVRLASPKVRLASPNRGLSYMYVNSALLYARLRYTWSIRLAQKYSVMNLRERKRRGPEDARAR